MRHGGRRANLASAAKRYAQADNRPKAVRTEQGAVPGNGAAPVVADNDRGRLSQGIEYAHHVADEVEQGVLVHSLRLFRQAIASHVGGDRPEARVAKRLQLVPPRIPGLRKAMTEQNERTSALFGDVHLDAVGRDRTMSQFGHDGPIQQRP